MSNDLRFKAPGVYKSDDATVSADTVNGGMSVLIKVPDVGYVGITVPIDVIQDILETQGYSVERIHEGSTVGLRE